MIIFEKNSESALGDMLDRLGDGVGLSAACFFFSGLSSGYSTRYRVRMAVSIIEDVFSDSDGFVFLMSDLDVIVVFDSGEKRLFDEAVYRLYYLFIEDPQIKVLGMEGFLVFYQLPDSLCEFKELCFSKINSMNEARNLASVEHKRAELFDFFDIVYEKLSGIEIREMISFCGIFAFGGNGDNCVRALSSVSVNMERLSGLFGFSFCAYLLTHLKGVLLHAVLDAVPTYKDVCAQPIVMIELMPSIVLSDSFSNFVSVMKEKGVSVIIDMDISAFFIDRKMFVAAVNTIVSCECDLCISNTTLSEIALLGGLGMDVSLFRVLWSSDFFNLALSNGSCIDKRRVIVHDCSVKEDFLLACAEGFCLFSGKFIDSVAKSNGCELLRI